MGDTRDDAVVESFVMNADHLKSCSCDMCCNPRRNKWNKASRATRKELLYTVDDQVS